MAQSTPPGISDLLGLFGGANPFAAVTKSIGQFQRGVSDFLSAVENFNKTMEQMNGVANRVNGLLDTLEEPLKAFVPQVTRTIKAADAMVEQLSGPIDRVTPGLSRLAEVLSAPALVTMPKDLSEFMNVLTDLAHRLQPLGQMAESAGSLFGLRPFGALRAATTPQPAPPPPPARVPDVRASAAVPAKKSMKKAPAQKQCFGCPAPARSHSRPANSDPAASPARYAVSSRPKDSGLPSVAKLYTRTQRISYESAI